MSAPGVPRAGSRDRRVLRWSEARLRERSHVFRAATTRAQPGRTEKRPAARPTASRELARERLHSGRTNQNLTSATRPRTALRRSSLVFMATRQTKPVFFHHRVEPRPSMNWSNPSGFLFDVMMAELLPVWNEDALEIVGTNCKLAEVQHNDVSSLTSRIYDISNVRDSSLFERDRGNYPVRWQLGSIVSSRCVTTMTSQTSGCVMFYVPFISGNERSIFNSSPVLSTDKELI